MRIFKNKSIMTVEKMNHLKDVYNTYMQWTYQYA